MRGRCGRAILDVMELWLVIVVILAAVLVIGSMLVAFGASWLVRHEPH